MAFFELNIAMSGLFAAQRGLQITSNNITNANTKGHSRQVLNQKASQPLSGFTVGMTGTGVSTTGVNRIRDSFIDNKLWTQNPRLGEFNIKVTENSVMEAAFGEPSDDGFTKVFNDMFSAISTLSTNPASNDAKTVVKENMVSFAKYYNNIAGMLEKQQKDINFQVKETVNEINSLATQIRSLNEQIFNAELYGNEASSFRDQRDNCIDRLSQIVPIDIEESEIEVKGNTVSKYVVRIGGEVLVDHFNVNSLGVEVREDKQNDRDWEGLYDIMWSTGNELDVTSSSMSGELKGLIDMRDGAGTGNENTYNGIPYYLDRLDGYVRTFAKTMNEQYSTERLKSKDTDTDIEAIAIEAIAIEGIGDADHIQKDKAGNVTLYKTVTVTVDGKDVKKLKKVGAINKVSTPAGEYSLTDASGGNAVSVTSVQYKDMLDKMKPSKELFSYTGANKTDYSKLSASNFAVEKSIVDEPFEMITQFDTSKPNDTSFMLGLLGQKDNKDMFNEGNPKDYMTSIFAELGINASESEMYQATQTAVTNNLKNQRLGVSQVDITEEFTYLIQYQQAYQAAAKIMNTIDGIYETTIFKLGNF